MPPAIQSISKIITDTTGIELYANQAGVSLTGIDPFGNGPIRKMRGKINAMEGCQLTFNIATIPPEEKLLTAPILQAVISQNNHLWHFPGNFVCEVIIQISYYRHSFNYTHVPASIQEISPDVSMLPFIYP